MARTVYYYAVMLITLVMMLGGMISAAINATTLVNPTPYHMSFDDYKEGKLHEYEDQKEVEPLSEEELQANYERQKVHEEEMERGYAVNNLVYSVFWILIPLPFFILARRQIKREEKE